VSRHDGTNRAKRQRQSDPAEGRCRPALGRPGGNGDRGQPCRAGMPLAIQRPDPGAQGESVYGDADTTDFVLAAAGAALLATALAHLLLVSTPGPLLFFWWIVGLASVAVVLYPFSTAAPLAGKAATAAADLVIGIAIGSLLSGVAERSTRVRQARRTL
jgi:hypothetical protein